MHDGSMCAQAGGEGAKQVSTPTGSPRKAAKSDVSIRITADASKQPPKEASEMPAAPSAADAAKPALPSLPRPAAPAAPAKKEEPSVLTMPRDEAWPRLLAYEVP